MLITETGEALLTQRYETQNRSLPCWLTRNRLFRLLTKELRNDDHQTKSLHGASRVRGTEPGADQPRGGGPPRKAGNCSPVQRLCGRRRQDVPPLAVLRERRGGTGVFPASIPTSVSSRTGRKSS